MSNPNVEQLHRLMATVNVADEDALSQRSGVALRQIYRLREGLIHTIPVAAIAKLAQCLEISVDQLLATFLPQALDPLPYTPPALPSSEPEPVSTVDVAALEAELANFKTEYDRLEEKLATQSEILQQQFQTAALDILEPWLLQWSGASHAAETNPEFPAKTLVMLSKPIHALLESWDIEAIATVGDIIEYDPQTHQLVKGGFDVPPGEPVIVRNVGYKQGDRLLHRVKVVAED